MMKTKNKTVVGLAVLLALFDGAAHAAVVSFAPPISSWAPGSSFSLDLVGAAFNSGNLDGGGISFTFDPTVINVTGIVVNTGDWEFFSDAGLVDNGTGSVTGITFNSFESRSGDLLFATVSFLAVGSGSSALALSEFAMNPFASGGSAYSGLELSQSGSITVVPLPSTALLLFGALLPLASAVRRGVSPARRLPVRLPPPGSGPRRG